MTAITSLASVITGSGLVTLLTALPLWAGRVSRNRIYGVRTRASLSDDDAWRRINVIGGRWLAIGSFPILLAGSIGFFLPESAIPAYGIAAGFVVFASVILPSIRLISLK